MKPLLDIKNLGKSYSNEKVLNSINLALYKSDVKVLLGKSGSGKSTLLKCINQLVTPTQGNISFENMKFSFPNKKKIDKKQLQQLRTKIGIVFQEHALWPHLSVLKNLVLAPIKTKLMTKQQAIIKANKLLDRFELLSKAESSPTSLSGGQKQRVAVARSLMMEPQILLFDEPTSALDPLMTQEIKTIIDDLKESGMGVIVSTHEIGFAKMIADEVCFLHQGDIVESGNKKIIDRPKTKIFKNFLNYSYEV